ncbi:MAG: 30S ribosomal protein S6 [Bacilli bacterium]|nr:30S ribosomal protein S6 [Bacilli bacterium]
MTEYLGMYIIRPKDLNEEMVEAVLADINKIFTDNGSEILEVNQWGMKDFAYEIQQADEKGLTKYRRGYYVKFKANATTEAVNEFTRVCNIREDILRHIIVKN